MVNVLNENSKKAVRVSACNFDLTDDLSPHTGKEIFLFSCPILRYNKYGWRNCRLLVLTQETLIILKQKSKAKEVRLRLSYSELKGLTISLHIDSSELVFHLEMQADLRISCLDARKEIVDTVKMFYATKTRENLPIYGVRQKNLGMYTAQESDVVKGISRIPLSLARLDEEDLVDIQ